MKPRDRVGIQGHGPFLPRLFSGLFGGLLGLALLKFGNPVVLGNMVERPDGVYEWLLTPWPIPFGYPLWVIVGLAGLLLFAAVPEGPKLRPVAVLPLLWLAWELVAGTRTVNPALTIATVQHFAVCVACFYLGFFCLARVSDRSLFFLGLLAGFVVVLAAGFEQHFGGLAETRRFFQLYTLPTLKEAPPELLKRMASNRIFSTLFYPNTLAGVLLLLLPAMLAFLWQSERWLAKDARVFLVAVLAGASLACLYWSGSKGGWLLMLLLGAMTLLRLRFRRRWKILLLSGGLALGLAGFFLRYAGFFEHGATSVSARFDYWRAAAATARAHPVWGTGPGTFGLAYQRIKRPDAEMSRLVHNDYLQQASDSGLAGCVAYAAFIIGALVLGRPRSSEGAGWLRFAVWLGVLGWSVQGCFEFGLYIPALAWPAFGFLGWLLGAPANRIDTPPPAR